MCACVWNYDYVWLLVWQPRGIKLITLGRLCWTTNHQIAFEWTSPETHVDLHNHTTRCFSVFFLLHQYRWTWEINTSPCKQLITHVLWVLRIYESWIKSLLALILCFSCQAFCYNTSDTHLRINNSHVHIFKLATYTLWMQNSYIYLNC